MGSRPFTHVATLLALAATYFAAAKLGLRLAFVAEQVTPVWPPTGIALAAIVILGYRVWPGIALGAFLANITANESVGAACGIAVGNTLEAVVGAWLLHRIVRFDGRLERLSDVLGLTVFSAACSTMISATIGVTSLCLGDVHRWNEFGQLWSIWWMGDATGALAVAPAILTWFTHSQVRRPRRPWEAIALGAATVGVCLTVFAAQAPWVTTDHPLEYAIFSLVVWAGLRFGQRGTATVIFATSVLAVWGTSHGSGPFSRGTVHENLILLQAFLSVVAITGLLLGAALAERDLADRRRSVDRGVTHILAEAISREDAAKRILHEVGVGLGWDAAAYWELDATGSALVCTQIWCAPVCRAEEFLHRTSNLRFPPGGGLPGRVWTSGEPNWIAEITHDPNFPRAESARQCGLRTGFAFPVCLGKEVLGIMEFFSREVRSSDQQLLQVLAAIGSQFGQFIDRRAPPINCANPRGTCV